MDREGGHSSKKMKNDSGYGVPTNARDTAEFSHKVAPSPVVHVRGLAEHVTDNDIHEAVLDFGIVSFITRIPNRNMALIEFEDVESASKLVSYAQSNTVLVGNKPAQFNYSTSTRIKRPDFAQLSIPNRVILLTIANARHPITVEVIHAICSPFGKVLRIVIFRKTGVQAMVEYDTIEPAARAVNSLHGQDIYSGCCTIKSDFAKPESLNVKRNTAETWDFTVTNLAKDVRFPVSPKNQPLLAEPRYGAGPLPFAVGGNDSYRRDIQYPIMQPYGDGFRGASGGYPASFNDEFDSHSRYTPLTATALLNAYESSHANGIAKSFGDSNNCVLMVYGMEKRFNCQLLFNLFCVYGNVIKIKFLKTKSGSAMVQMGDYQSCERVMQNLNGVLCFGSELALSLSKQPYLQDVVRPHVLIDGTSAYEDFINSRHHRFNSPDAITKLRAIAPTSSLYFYNAPPNMDVEVLRQLIISAGVKEPEKIISLKAKSEKSSRGKLQWFRVESATEALICCNHSQIPNPIPGRPPFVLKLAYTNPSE